MHFAQHLQLLYFIMILLRVFMVTMVTYLNSQRDAFAAFLTITKNMI